MCKSLCPLVKSGLDRSKKPIPSADARGSDYVGGELMDELQRRGCTLDQNVVWMQDLWFLDVANDDAERLLVNNGPHRTRHSRSVYS